MAPTATKAKAVEEAPDDVVEILEPSSQEYVFILGEDGPDPITFVQKPLGFMGKMKLFAVLSKTLTKVMGRGVSLSELIDVPDSSSMPLSGDASKEADIFVKSITNIASEAPELTEDLFCVILAVPASQQEYIKKRFDEDLTDEQGFAILNTFVDQNWEVLYDFFTGKGLNLFKKITEKFQK